MATVKSIEREVRLTGLTISHVDEMKGEVCFQVPSIDVPTEIFDELRKLDFEDHEVDEIASLMYKLPVIRYIRKHIG